MQLILIDGVSLPVRHQRRDGDTASMTQFPVEGVITAEHGDAMPLQKRAHLEIGISHFQTERFRFRGTCHDAAVRVGQYDDWALSQLWSENAFTAAVEAVTTNDISIDLL